VQAVLRAPIDHTTPGSTARDGTVGRLMDALAPRRSPPRRALRAPPPRELARGAGDEWRWHHTAGSLGQRPHGSRGMCVRRTATIRQARGRRASGSRSASPEPEVMGDAFLTMAVGTGAQGSVSSRNPCKPHEGEVADGSNGTYGSARTVAHRVPGRMPSTASSTHPRDALAAATLPVRSPTSAAATATPCWSPGHHDFQSRAVVACEGDNLPGTVAHIVQRCRLADVAICRRIRSCWATAAGLWPEPPGHLNGVGHRAPVELAHNWPVVDEGGDSYLSAVTTTARCGSLAQRFGLRAGLGCPARTYLASGASTPRLDSPTSARDFIGVRG
jgi:hypothetical protein